MQVRCRILDDLGLARQRTKDLAGAQRNFEAALQLRQDGGTDYDVCQSLVNLARLEVIAGELEIAAGYADHVLKSLRGTPPPAQPLALQRQRGESGPGRLSLRRA